VILGCTHFPLISKPLQEYFGKDTKLIHSGGAIVAYLEEEFDFTEKFTEPNMKFFASENPDALKSVAKSWLKL